MLAKYNNTTYFAHPDHLGSTRLFTGLDLRVSGFVLTNPEQKKFRQYSSSLGRWMHPDPAGLAAVNPSNPQSWNRYGYVFNSPMSFIDPLGLCGDGPSSMTVNSDGSVTVSADAPCCDPGTTMRSIGIPGGTMFICLGYGDTTTNVQQAINQAMSQGPGGSGTANNARSNPMQPSPTYNKCNQQAMTQTGPLTPNAESIITSVMAAIMSYVLPGGGSAQSLLRGAAITQGSRLVVKAEIYQGQLNSCLESNGIR